jgi:hypothetical protein
VEKHKHNAYQQILYTDLNRISSLSDKRLTDWLLHRMLFVAGATPNVKVANNTSAYFPDDSCLVEYVSGDRSTGVTFSVAVGVGFKKFSSGQPDADAPEFLPIVIDSADSFVTDNSDPTNPRIDRVFLKPVYTDENQDTVNIIDPSPPNNITAESRYLNNAYRYELAYVAGTPASSPSPPSPPSGFIAADAIADILIQPGAGAFNPSDLTDTRVLLEMDDQLVPAVTSLPAGSITVSPTVLGESDAQAALEALETAVGNAVPAGLLNARLVYVNTLSVKLDVALGTLIEIEIDDTVLTDAGPITFDITADLESPQTESASTPYYLYVYNSAGTILHKISETAPEDNVALKVGYHPTNTGWRCVGCVINDASSNFIPFLTEGQAMRFKGYSSDLYWSLSTTSPLAWGTLDLSILPEAVTAVQLAHAVLGEDGIVCFGASDASVALPTGTGDKWYSASGMDDVIFRNGTVEVPGGDAQQNDAYFKMPIADPASPAIRYGNVETLASAYLNSSKLKLASFDYPYLPLF